MANKVGFEGVEKGLELSAIGNCSYTALVDRRGCLVWCCFPRYDGDPVFCSLLRKSKDIGFFEIEVSKSESIKQEYVENTAVLKTRITDSQGGCVEITDFAPRFKKYERIYRPNMLLRQIVPISGRPRIRIRLRPTFGYGWGVPEKTRGSNHIRYLLPTMTLRLTTNAPVSYIVDEVLFEIEETIQLFLMPDESLTEPMNDIAILHLKSTIEYWQDFTRTLSIPLDWQEQVIRSCISLKLCFFEETGAIIRAATTSIPCYPDDPESTNFDHRYCFLEDAYDITSTLREVGAVEIMQSYLRFISNIVACYGTEGAFDDEINWQETEMSGRLGPAYGIALESKLFEKEMHRLVGYRGMQPVRCGFKDFAANRLHIYGIVIMTLTQLFYDNRLGVRGDVTMFHRLETLAKYAIKEMEQVTEITTSIAAATGEPTSQKPGPSVYSHAVLWGACDRLAKISLKLGLSERNKHWSECAINGKRRVYEKGLHPITKDHFVATMGGTTVEPKLLQLPNLGFVEATDPIFLKTLEKIEDKYKKGKFIVVDDEWNGLHNTTSSGVPSVATISKPKKTTVILAPVLTKSDTDLPTRANKKKIIARTIHTLWYIQALAMAGKENEGREIFNYILSAVNTCGLLSDSIDVYSGELWGNFPATVCMGGILRCASLLSRNWSNVL